LGIDAGREEREKQEIVRIFILDQFGTIIVPSAEIGRREEEKECGVTLTWRPGNGEPHMSVCAVCSTRICFGRRMRPMRAGLGRVGTT
jgi:hypothetical protein